MSDDIRAKREELRQNTRQEAECILKLAGFTIQYVWELANGYWPDSTVFDEVRKPWWLFATDMGLIQIGWRKRVLEICWRACAFRGIVTKDQTTVTEELVHAWSIEKAVEYLRTFRQLNQK